MDTLKEFVASHLGSENFSSAISDLRYFFPDGVHTEEASTVLKDYNVRCTHHCMCDSNLLFANFSAHLS